MARLRLKFLALPQHGFKFLSTPLYRSRGKKRNTLDLQALTVQFLCFQSKEHYTQLWDNCTHCSISENWDSPVCDQYESQGRTSDFALPTSDFRLLTSEFRLPTSDFRLRTSDFRLPTFDFRLPTSDFRLPTIDFRLLTSEFRLPTSDLWLLSSDFRLPIFDFRLPTSDFWLLSSDFRLPTSYFLLPTLKFKGLIFDVQVIYLEIESILIKSESCRLLFLGIVAWLRMSLNTMFITAVCVIFLAKSDVRFRVRFQYLYYYVSVS